MQDEYCLLFSADFFIILEGRTDLNRILPADLLAKVKKSISCFFFQSDTKENVKGNDLFFEIENV